MRRGRKKAANKDRVFGCDLLEHLAASSQEIPQVLRCCSEFIEEHGIVDGIYRLSGVSSNTQKLRGEFDSEVPDLGKEVYLQDIHCVSSLCKAYFRELPNPLLTYQLYDKFADAVAVQLEEERLVKINEVLKDLPLPHYRTLEYLMRHLVKMATFASETNMHSRNLAIVWAPNLLRSRDIEATGLNGTAAFMEVRVQSIVVEFILTHVSQLFSIPGLVSERRKSLPSPSVLSGQEEPFFRAMPYNFPSTLSPGNGPPAMRPYHAIIEGTDKRKGSLKGRKWKSIFNLGGRLHDTRRKNKSNGKEKEKVSLRPAKSMDSLSSAPYTPEGTRPHLSPSPLAQPSPNLGREAGSPGGVVGGAVGGAGSGYAVTYRRGGGASVSVVGGGGVPGTYIRLDSGENTATDSPSPQPRSPGISSRAERRAGMHISGPFSVTVPLHITSGLALGVLQGGANREEGAVQREEGGANIDEGVVTREEGGADRENVGSHTEEGREGRREQEGKRDESREGGVEGKKTEVNRLEEGREAGTGEEMTKERFSVEEVTKERISVEETEPVGAEEELDSMGKSGTSSPEDHDSQLPLDFQDTFGFLDLMDSSAYNQVNEFSVEPPCFEEEDYDEEEPCYPGESPSMLTPEKLAQPPQTHRPLTSDPYGHPCKSHSLPYKSRPFLPAPSSSSSSSPSEDEDEEEGSDEEENMLFYSLPSRLQFQAARERETDTHTKAGADAQGQNSNVNAFGQSEGGLEHSVPRPPDTDWLVAVAVSMPGELGQNGSTEVEDSLELKTKMEEEGEPPANTANGERDYTVALTDTHEPRCVEGESGFAVRGENHHAPEQREGDHTAEHSATEPKERDHTAEHSATEAKERDHTAEHSATEAKERDHTAEHSATEAKERDHTAEHSATEAKERDHTAEHSATEAKKKDHTDEHSATEAKERDHTAEHSATEAKERDHTDEHSAPEQREGDHTAEHSATEPKERDHTAEHTDPEERDHTAEHTEPEERDHTAEHIEPEERDHTAEHTEPEERDHTAEHIEPKERDHTAEHTDPEERDHAAEHIDPEERDHTAEHIEPKERNHTAEHTEPEERDHTAEHIEPKERDHTAEHTDPEERDHTAEHIEPKERDHTAEHTNPEERDHTAEHTDPEERDRTAEQNTTEPRERLHKDLGPGGKAESHHGSPEDPECCHGDSVNRTELAAELTEHNGSPEPCHLPLPAPRREPITCTRLHQEPPSTPGEQDDTCREDEKEREQEGGREREQEGLGEGGREKNMESRNQLDMQEKEQREEKREESEERNVTSGGLEEGRAERDDRMEKENVQLIVRERDEEQRAAGIGLGMRDEEQRAAGIGQGVGRTLVEQSKGGEEDRREQRAAGIGQGMRNEEQRAAGIGLGVGRTLVYSKQAMPKVYHAKAVPVVPPKPQLSLTLRQQLQQRERDRGREGEGDREREGKRDGGNEGELERGGEDGRSAEKEVKRNSGVSICFDVAVARATERRGRERERGKEGQGESRRGAEKD